MQRDPVELGAFHHQPRGFAYVPEKSVATRDPGRVRHPTRSYSKRIPDPGDRSALRAYWSAYDRQRGASPRWAILFCAVIGAAVFVALAVAARRARAARRRGAPPRSRLKIGDGRLEAEGRRSRAKFAKFAKIGMGG